MRSTLTGAAAAALLIAAASGAPAFALGDGGNGGDREPAGGAFMSSYPEQGSTGLQMYGPPRSADVPRGYRGPDATGSLRRSPPPLPYDYGR